MKKSTAIKLVVIIGVVYGLGGVMNGFSMLMIPSSYKSILQSSLKHYNEEISSGKLERFRNAPRDFTWLPGCPLFWSG